MNSRFRFGLFSSLVSSALLVAPLSVAGVVALDDGSLAPGDAGGEDWFGYSVAVQQDTAVVGAWGHQGEKERSGAAYVFSRTTTGWGAPLELTQADPAYDHRFGNSVALAAGDILVGAHHDESEVWASGSVYIFRHDGSAWKQVQKLLPDQKVDDGRFGITLAASESTVVVGSRAGEAYVIVQEGGTWKLQAVLKANDGAGADERFGLRVAIDADVAVIGAPDATVKESLDGAAYVFARTGSAWTLAHKLSAPAAAAYDSFGNAVAVSGDTILIGSPFDDEAGSDAGAVYVIRKNGSTWDVQDKIMPTGLKAGNKFGDALSIFGDIAVVGAPGDDQVATSAGAAYILQKIAGTWTVRDKIVRSASGAEDGFATAVATDGKTLIIGSPGDDHAATDAGMAYSYRLLYENGDPCTEASSCVSGHCVDGVCCESACEGGATTSCRACREHLGSTKDGVCGYASTTIECAPSTCTGPGIIRLAGMCDGQGQCGEGKESACNGGFVCKEGACLDSCGTASECIDGYRCDEANACIALAANGDACASEAECASGFCVQGVCCNESCHDGTCQTGTCKPSDGHGGASGGGGAGGSGGSKPSAASSDDDDGCGCRTVGNHQRSAASLAWLLMAVPWAWRRRNR